VCVLHYRAVTSFQNCRSLLYTKVSNTLKNTVVCSYIINNRGTVKRDVLVLKDNAIKLAGIGVYFSAQGSLIHRVSYIWENTVASSEDKQ